MATILYASGKKQEVDVKDINLCRIQQEINGHPERIVTSNRTVLYVNDEAAITGLPYNHEASIIADLRLRGTVISMTKEEDNEWQR